MLIQFNLGLNNSYWCLPLFRLNAFIGHSVFLWRGKKKPTKIYNISNEKKKKKKLRRTMWYKRLIFENVGLIISKSNSKGYMLKPGKNRCHSQERYITKKKSECKKYIIGCAH